MELKAKPASSRLRGKLKPLSPEAHCEELEDRVATPRESSNLSLLGDSSLFSNLLLEPTRAEAVTRLRTAGVFFEVQAPRRANQTWGIYFSRAIPTTSYLALVTKGEALLSRLAAHIAAEPNEELKK